jgi:Bacteriophage lambda head decoration protein D
MILNPVTETFQNEDQSWLGTEHGTSACPSITLDTSAFTAGTHYPNGYFPSGLALGKITATGLYAPYVDANSDGTGVLAGFLFCSVDAPASNLIDVPAALYEHGAVIVAKLPIPGSVDANGKADTGSRIIYR